MQPIETAQHILLCLRYGIGDVVMQTSVLDALRGAAPRARITALAAEPAVELLEDDPRVDEVVSAGRWGLTHRWDDGDDAAREALARWVRDEGFDVFLDVHHAVRAVADAVWGQGIRSYEADEHAEAEAVAAGEVGATAIKRAVRAGWGLTVPEEAAPRLHLSFEARRFAERFVAEHSPDSPPLGLSPVASLPMKRWPAERFAEVADRLAEEMDGTLLLFCGPQQAEGEKVLAVMRHDGRVVMVGPQHLGRVAALLRHCALFVCNDTGLMHMAAAVGTPTVGVFGPTSPRVFLPPASATGVGGWEVECPYRHAASLHPPGCWSSGECLIGVRSCIDDVSVDEVLDAARQARVRWETGLRSPTASA